MTTKWNPKINCKLKNCIGEECPIYSGVPRKIFDEPIYVTCGADKDGIVSSIFHFKNTTVVENQTPKGSEKECVYQIIAEGSEEKEAIDEIRKYIKSWSPIELIE